MLQWLYTYVAICFKCCSNFKRMLQVFYLDVAYVANDYIRMLQVYVSNVSAISNVLQVFI
jgi:hypothetical protein